MTKNRPRLIKNGNAGTLDRGGSFTPEQIERAQQHDLELMTAAIEAIDGWETMSASRVAQELLKMGTVPPEGTDEVVGIWI